MIVGCYILHLYCETAGCKKALGGVTGNFGSGPVEFTHPTHEKGAVAEARARGWKLDLKHWTALCPQCAKK